jgi:hypothetical protein
LNKKKKRKRKLKKKTHTHNINAKHSIHWKEKLIVERENMMIMINPILIKNDRYSSSKIARNKEQVIGATMIVEQWTHTQVCNQFRDYVRMEHSLFFFSAMSIH